MTPRRSHRRHGHGYIDSDRRRRSGRVRTRRHNISSRGAYGPRPDEHAALARIAARTGTHRARVVAESSLADDQGSNSTDCHLSGPIGASGRRDPQPRPRRGRIRARGVRRGVDDDRAGNRALRAEWVAAGPWSVLLQRARSVGGRHRVDFSPAPRARPTSSMRKTGIRLDPAGPGLRANSPGRAQTHDPADVSHRQLGPQVHVSSPPPCWARKCIKVVCLEQGPVVPPRRWPRTSAGLGMATRLPTGRFFRQRSARTRTTIRYTAPTDRRDVERCAGRAPRPPPPPHPHEHGRGTALSRRIIFAGIRGHRACSSSAG